MNFLWILLCKSTFKLQKILHIILRHYVNSHPGTLVRFEFFRHDCKLSCKYMSVWAHVCVSPSCSFWTCLTKIINILFGVSEPSLKDVKCNHDLCDKNVFLNMIINFEQKLFLQFFSAIEHLLLVSKFNAKIKNTWNLKETNKPQKAPIWPLSASFLSYKYFYPIGLFWNGGNTYLWINKKVLNVRSSKKRRNELVQYGNINFPIVFCIKILRQKIFRKWT